MKISKLNSKFPHEETNLSFIFINHTKKKRTDISTTFSIIFRTLILVIQYMFDWLQLFIDLWSFNLNSFLTWNWEDISANYFLFGKLIKQSKCNCSSFHQSNTTVHPQDRFKTIKSSGNFSNKYFTRQTAMFAEQFSILILSLHSQWNKFTSEWVEWAWMMCEMRVWNAFHEIWVWNNFQNQFNNKYSIWILWLCVLLFSTEN